MKREEAVFLSILKSYFCEKKDNSETFSEIDFERLMHIAKAHHLFPIVYDSLKNNYPLSVLNIDSVRENAMSKSVFQAKSTAKLLDVYSYLLQNGVSALVVKGIVLRLLYKNPDERSSSDEDLLINEKDFFLCDKLLKSKGFVCRENTDKILREVTYYSQDKKLRLEIHTKLFENTIKKFVLFNKCMENCFENCSFVVVENTKVFTLNETMHLIYLVLHSLKHFVYGGVGIRQVCDIALFTRHYADKIDFDYVTKILSELSAEKFLINVFACAEKYLGITIDESIPYKEKISQADCENMIEDIVSGGIYAASHQERLHSAAMTSGVFNGEITTKHSVFAAFFPPFRIMKERYDYVNRFPPLIIFAWIARIFKNLKNKKAGRNSVELGKKRIELLKQYEII